jgi:Fe-S-cluster containining protein
MFLTLAPREHICLACKSKPCCSYYTVMPTGRDVWRIVRAMHLQPADFLRTCEMPEAAPGRFLLATGAPYHTLILAKRPLPPPLAAPCVFLVRTNDGHARCGLGELRPAKCQTYPVTLEGDRVGLINDPEGCVRSWSLADIDIREERGRLGEAQAEEEEYHAIVQAWNRRVLEGGRERSFQEYCAYLLNQYAAREEQP